MFDSVKRLVRRWRQQHARRRLERTLRPDPAYLERRLRQLSPERRARFERNARLEP